MNFTHTVSLNSNYNSNFNSNPKPSPYPILKPNPKKLQPGEPHLWWLAYVCMRHEENIQKKLYHQVHKCSYYSVIVIRNKEIQQFQNIRISYHHWADDNAMLIKRLLLMMWCDDVVWKAKTSYKTLAFEHVYNSNCKEICFIPGVPKKGVLKHIG